MSSTTLFNDQRFIPFCSVKCGRAAIAYANAASALYSIESSIENAQYDIVAYQSNRAKADKQKYELNRVSLKGTYNQTKTAWEAIKSECLPDDS